MAHTSVWYHDDCTIDCDPIHHLAEYGYGCGARYGERGFVGVLGVPSESRSDHS